MPTAAFAKLSEVRVDGFDVAIARLDKVAVLPAAAPPALTVVDLAVGEALAGQTGAGQYDKGYDCR